MRAAHTVEQVRAAEAALMATVPDGTLMQRAAAGLASAVGDLLGATYGARVLVLVGPGDNGGDALFAGAMLARRGAHVQAVSVADQVHEAGSAALRRAGGRLVDLADVRRPDVVVDGIVGIGGHPGLRPPATEALARVEGVPLVAVDTPSGLDVDTGRLEGDHVTADITVTFGTHKICHLVEPAASACGVVQLVDIGLDLPAAPVSALQADDVAALLPTPPVDAQKYTRGVVGVRAGSARYPGAGVLSTAGASCGLAGMVRYAGGAPDAVRAAHPEVVVGDGRVQAWVVGSGGDAEAAEALTEALKDDVPLV
ncbi:MAG: NAD(P)H-hydrate epimerase, partial [Nocardioides sp.]